jgi:hypothetical protein
MRFRKTPPTASPAVTTEAVVDSAALREAYARGRRDERARHRRSPALLTAIALAAVVGGAAMVSAAVRGSFEGGGQLIDTQLVTAAREAKPALKSAAHGAQKLIRGDRNEVAADG